MNLYEVRAAAPERFFFSASPAGDGSKLLKCSSHKRRQAYYSNFAIEHKYKVDCVDTALKKNDSIWIDWDLCRNRILKLCERRPDDGKKRRRLSGSNSQ